jgi:hypothetical protein
MDVLANHHYTQTGEEAVRDIFRAGTDSDCGSFVHKFGPSALKQGLIKESDLDLRLKNLFRVRMRLGTIFLWYLSRCCCVTFTESYLYLDMDCRCCDRSL